MNKNLQYFKGKVCSVFTQPTNRNFKEESPETFPQQIYFYFVGVVEDIDEDGLLLTQIQTGFKSYFFKQSIIGIAEEQWMDPQNPQHAAEINKIKEANKEVREKLKKYEENKGEYVNPDELTNMLKNIKKGPGIAK